LNLSAIVGRSAEAKERRLVPEVVEQFFIEAAPESGIRPKPLPKEKHVFQIGRVPRNLLPVGDGQESRYGRLARDYGKIIFDKRLLATDPTLEWVTPGHPLFEAVRIDLLSRTQDHLRRGAVFFDLHREKPSLVDIFAASIKDGRGSTLHRRLFVVESSSDKTMAIREPTLLHDITPAPAGTKPPTNGGVPSRQQVEQFVYQRSLEPWVARIACQRRAEVDRVARHVQISLNSLIDCQQVQLGEYLNRQMEGKTVPGLDGLIAQAEHHLDELNVRLETRRRELALEAQCMVADIAHLGRAWVVSHPDRTSLDSHEGE
jgi:hypothetical protein